ncbi:MAG TPA: BON domain-containing protein [Anaerolineae bacterium]|nr:BON domain-containing protein [Anaerolineae bacterium]HOQ98912.1 BON domain-containing protein [Anaerolineae bacterium]HPL26508.1 BON domain-containing protein [Anaerolineae bacterium]
MAERKDDQRLENEVRAELKRNVFLEPLGIQVSADKGTITLVGSVDSELTRQTAEDMARLVVGVDKVNNQLTLMGPESSTRADSELEREITAQIAADNTIEQPERFHVRSRFGQVFVSGTAESEEEHESVVLAVQRVPGVETIEDRIDVKIPVIGS